MACFRYSIHVWIGTSNPPEGTGLHILAQGCHHATGSAARILCHVALALNHLRQLQPRCQLHGGHLKQCHIPQQCCHLQAHQRHGLQQPVKPRGPPKKLQPGLLARLPAPPADPAVGALQVAAMTTCLISCGRTHDISMSWNEVCRQDSP